MGDLFLFLAFVLIMVGIVTREGFIFVLLYLFLGTFLFSFGWLRRVMERISMVRRFPERAFVGEEIPVTVTVQNASRLPALYLQFEEKTPPELSGAQLAQQVISLKGRQADQIQYILRTHKRGRYPIGPARVMGGDLLGLVKEQRKELAPGRITVYPRVLPLPQLGLPMQAPLGNLRHFSPIFEDPSQPIGKRGYQPGDPLRHIDWKASASAGKLQTRVFQPSIDLNTMVFLDLDKRSYQDRNRYQANEFAIVVVASLASWVIGNKQSAGLVTNGMDPLAAAGGSLHRIAPQKGQAQLMEILELLARIDAAQEIPLVTMLQQGAGSLSWGTTVMIVTGQVESTLLEALLPLQQKGLNPVLISCGAGHNREIAAYADAIHLPYYGLRHELELSQLGSAK